MKRHVIRSIKAVTGSLGGLSAVRNVPLSVVAAAGLFDADPRTTRVMVVDVIEGRVVIQHDHVFRDRIDHSEEERRAGRLDEIYDPTVHDVFWPECHETCCVHIAPVRTA